MPEKSQSSERQIQRSPQSEAGGTLHRSGGFPTFFDIAPREFFSMSPWAMMRHMAEEADRSLRSWRHFDEQTWLPPIDVSEHDHELVVRADLPGLRKDEVKVETTEQGIVIEGDRRRAREEERGGYLRSERSYGHFCRMIPLPEGASINQAKAHFRDGVLEVTVPIPETKAQRKEIPISAE